jgi:hypothetical protein
MAPCVSLCLLSAVACGRWALNPNRFRGYGGHSTGMLV